jgi:hypothetical protein
MSTYIIRNSIGCEVTRVTASNADEALINYAVSVEVQSERLLEIGWRSEEVMKRRDNRNVKLELEVRLNPDPDKKPPSEV